MSPFVVFWKAIFCYRYVLFFDNHIFYRCCLEGNNIDLTCVCFWENVCLHGFGGKPFVLQCVAGLVGKRSLLKGVWRNFSEHFWDCWRDHGPKLSLSRATTCSKSSGFGGWQKLNCPALFALFLAAGARANPIATIVFSKVSQSWPSSSKPLILVFTSLHWQFCCGRQDPTRCTPI